MDMATFLKPTMILDRDMINQITNSHGQLSLPIELPPTAVYYLIPLPSPPMMICGMQYVGEAEDRVPTQSSALPHFLQPWATQNILQSILQAKSFKKRSEELNAGLWLLQVNSVPTDIVCFCCT